MGVLQLFGTFYEKSNRDGRPSIGDIYWVPTPHIEETPRIFDVIRSDPHSHVDVDFEISEIANHHFKERPDRLPIKLLSLGSTEELVITKAKKRPAIVLYSSCLDDAETLSSMDKRLARHIAKRCFAVAPFYSPASVIKPGPFMPTLVARIRAMRYPHLVCLPKLGSNKPEPGEVIRLDRLFITHLGRGCVRSDWKLHGDIVTLISDQLHWTSHGPRSEFLETVIDTVKDCLPPELEPDSKQE